MDLRSRMDTVLVLLLIALCGVMIAGEVREWVTPRQAAPALARTPSVEIPSAPITLEGAPVRGAATARVAMVVFSEFHCPFCARLAESVLPHIE